MPTSLSATRPDAKAQAWPALPLDEWRDTYTTILDGRRWPEKSGWRRRR